MSAIALKPVTGSLGEIRVEIEVTEIGPIAEDLTLELLAPSGDSEVVSVHFVGLGVSL